MNQLFDFLSNELGIPKADTPKVAEFFEEESFLKGDMLVHHGRRYNQMNLIKSGYLRFFSYSDKKVVTHWIFGKNQFVTDVDAFFFQKESKWNIEALTDTIVFSINRSKYERLRSSYPEWDYYEKLFLVKLLSALENRVYTLLSMTAEERFRFLFQSDSNMFNELPLQYIASMLGMTPETLSRVRNKFSS